jgi:hypothetical protein
MNEFSKLALGQLEKKGLQVNEVNFADFKNLVKPVYKKWAPVLGPEIVEVLKKVRHPPQSGWLDEWGHFKGGRPLYQTPGSYEILRQLNKTKKCFAFSPSVPHS